MASNLKFKTEWERYLKAQQIAREGLKLYSPAQIAVLGEQQILSDLVHEALMSLPSSPETPD